MTNSRIKPPAAKQSFQLLRNEDCIFMGCIS